MIGQSWDFVGDSVTADERVSQFVSKCEWAHAKISL